jgi:hypothetical protein
MQEAVNHEMRKMLDESNLLLAGFAPQRLERKADVANEPDHRAERGELGEAQDVGRLVDAAPVAVERLLVRIVGQKNRDFGDPDLPRLGVLQSLGDGGFGDGVEPIRPLAGLDRDGNAERRGSGTQLDLSSLAVAPS